MVVYEGRLSGDEIEGVWTTPSVRGNSGRFLMIRGRRMADTAEPRIAEKA